MFVYMLTVVVAVLGGILSRQLYIAYPINIVNAICIISLLKYVAN